MKKRIWSFVITGGPCSGKTTALSIIEQELSSRGYYILIIPETATELISTGIRPFGNCMKVLPFQRVLLEKQLHKEKLYRKVAQMIPAEKIVILHDRGIVDNKSYITDKEFQELLTEFSMNEVEAKDRYDAVFHLVSAANGAEDFYTLENNTARTETIEEARELDARGIANWTGHSHLHIIDNSTNFEEKMDRLMSKIYSALGDPIPIEIEKKYLIKRPNLDEIAKNVPITVVDIVQTYLKSNNDIERRIRQRGQNGNFSYYFSEKKVINGLKRIGSEKKISEKDYINYLSDVDILLSPVIKKRVCFVYCGQYFGLDIFDFSEDKSLIEVKLTDENNSVKLPNFINIIKDVTGNVNYRNYNLAQRQTL